MDAAKVREGFQIFAASPADDDHIQAAKDFITKNGLTSEDVKLGRVGNSIVVVAKKEIMLLF